MTREVTIKGKVFELEGKEVLLGKKAPDCTLVNHEMEDVKLSTLLGKVTLLIVVPSVDTPTCSIEAKRFNTELALLSSSVQPLLVSMDLPFAQKRWCGTENVEKLKMLSDFRHKEFAEKYGVMIKDLGILARAVFLIDHEGVMRYMQVVDEVSNEPDYDRTLEEIDHLLANV